jgi:hypothetical protein
MYGNDSGPDQPVDPMPAQLDMLHVLVELMVFDHHE